MTESNSADRVMSSYNLHKPVPGPYWKAFTSFSRVVAVVVLLVFVWLMMGSPSTPAPANTISPLKVFWKIIVPLVPLSLLIAPVLWRNICPLVFFNMVGHHLRCLFASKQSPAPDYRYHPAKTWARVFLVKYGLAIGIVLLVVLVPARLLLFNSNAPALAILLVALAIVTCSAGMILPFKSGFCTSVCPVYPVEASYGMKPFIAGINTLCTVPATETSPALICGGCIRDCLDLRLVPAAKRKARHQSDWRPQSFLRFFISVFPGFVLAYYVLDQFVKLSSFTVLMQCLIVYGSFLGLMAVSGLIYQLIRKTLVSGGSANLQQSWRLDLAWVAVAFNVYYWMALPGWVELAGPVLGLPTQWVSTVSLLLYAGIMCLSLSWLRRAW